jgi:hypothetical protein
VLHNILHVPEIAKHLLSVHKFPVIMMSFLNIILGIFL